MQDAVLLLPKAFYDEDTLESIKSSVKFFIVHVVASKYVRMNKKSAALLTCSLQAYDSKTLFYFEQPQWEKGASDFGQRYLT